MNMGGTDRIGICWFHDWLAGGDEHPVSRLLEEIFTQLIFVERLRMALGRFNGQVQRLRFFLGDEGIVQSDSAADLGQQPPSAMDEHV